MKKELIHEELSGKIIGAAMDVLNELKPGLDERLYERALVVVDPKVVAAFNEAHIAQMVGYLTISGLELALLLNFKSARLDWKRVVRQHKTESETADLHA